MRMPISRAWLALTRNSPVPFLYQTRTLAARPTRSLNTHAPRGSDEDTPDAQDETSSPASGATPPRKPRRSYLQRRAASVTPPPPPAPHTLARPSKRHTPTMTQGEKQVFSELLEQIGVRPEAPSPPADADTHPDPSPAPQASSLSDADRSEMAQISAIFDSVLKDMKRRRGRAASKTVDAAAAAAASADEAAATTGLPPGEDADADADIGHALQEKRVSTERAIELVVQREAGKIEAALRAAVESGAGDTAIWAVCKGRIFSMLRHLDSADVSALPISDASVDDGERETLTVPPGVPHEPVVVALYPQMLLVAFRLLNLHYPGSPLIAQFRATIKAHGRASAVLGSSTGLYNELIYFAWRGAHDLPGVVALLQEMEVTGVEGDGRTCALLDGIARQRERDLTEHRRRVRPEPGGGAAREPWWDLAPNRRAVRELFGPEGWMERLTRRVRAQRERERERSR
ncbi:hypothetical protein ATEIFO6365_0006052000 [Aspergillus terreus]|uniref:Mtf2-like C-terminal domain-containing protein n=1 Tax=Aspergillus terreus TaxID=33178 RepID=A0A5M3YX62_ASPTE|nr:hypothetical protein ATETN484_0005051800 [Aspergillus terreus]GFF17183.1 hypothetical protein ATEIFO6365_0006052000 [Aspergillus terreus]